MNDVGGLTREEPDFDLPEERGSHDRPDGRGGRGSWSGPKTLASLQMLPSPDGRGWAVLNQETPKAGPRGWV